MCPDEDNVEIAAHTFERDYHTDYDRYDPEPVSVGTTSSKTSRPPVLSLAARWVRAIGSSSPTRTSAGAPRNGRSPAPRMGSFRIDLPICRSGTRWSATTVSHHLRNVLNPYLSPLVVKELEPQMPFPRRCSVAWAPTCRSRIRPREFPADLRDGDHQVDAEPAGDLGRASAAGLAARGQATRATPASGPCTCGMTMP